MELELLSVPESIQLLLSVAEMDTSVVPPACLTIAQVLSMMLCSTYSDVWSGRHSQLCGRLPLCLNIVGNLIRTFGDGWEDEVATMFALLFWHKTRHVKLFDMGIMRCLLIHSSSKSTVSTRARHIAIGAAYFAHGHVLAHARGRSQCCR